MSLTRLPDCTPPNLPLWGGIKLYKPKSLLLRAGFLYINIIIIRDRISVLYSSLLRRVMMYMFRVLL